MRIQLLAWLLQRLRASARPSRSPRRRTSRRLTYEMLGARLPLAGEADFFGAPTANDDVYAAYHDQVVSVPAPGVLANDSDPSGQALTAVVLDPPLHGGVSLTANGAFVYTPTTAYVGEDQWSYRVIDSDGNESTLAVVTILVGPGISISDVATSEGGIATFSVTLTLAPLVGQHVTVRYVTMDRTAHTQDTCDDYVPVTGTLTFSPGQLSHTIAVQTLQDVLPEEDESFDVILSQPTGAYIIDGTGTGTILNDDAPVIVPLQHMVTSTESGVPGQSTVVKVYDGLTESLAFAPITPYPGFTGSVRVAADDFNLDGTADIVTVPGSGWSPQVRVFDGVTGLALPGPIGAFFAYDPAFSYGLFVAAADINGDGRPDIVTGTDSGVASNLLVFSGVNAGLIWNTAPYGGFAGGVRVGTGDTNGDGRADIITGAGPGGGPLVLVFSGMNQATVAGVYAYAPSFPGGVYVAGGDINADGRADIVTGAGASGGPHVRAFSGPNQAELANFFAYLPSFTGGVRVGAGDVSGIGMDSILTIPGLDGGAHAKAFETDGTELCGFFVDAPTKGSFVTTRQSPAVIVSAADLTKFNVNDSVAIYSNLDGPAERRFITAVDGINQRLVLDFPLTSAYSNAIVSHGGRDEVDLMRIIIKYPPSLQPAQKGSVTLKVLAGQVRVWTSSTKGTEVLLPKTFTASEIGNGKELWVEATGVSTSLRDIKLAAEHNGTTTAVAGTAIWAQMVSVKHDLQADESEPGGSPGPYVFDEWSDIAGPVRDRIDERDGVGVRPPSATQGLLNVIALQFTILPQRQPGSGTWENDEVQFDASRTGTVKLWWQNVPGGEWLPLSVAQGGGIVKFRPVPVERANDEPKNNDESEVATTSGHFYSEDAPGYSGGLDAPAGAHGYANRMNFEEWLRVKFDGGRPISDPADTRKWGSRVSPLVLWHTALTLKAVGGQFQRNNSPGASGENPENEITLGNPPLLAPSVT